jgi:RsiW-degrading membrane proteinase PrsW (M82 family)
MKNIFLFGIISLLPILAWIWFFQKQNREKRKMVLLTFLAGTTAVIPIKLYEKYWNTSILFFEHVNLFEYFSNLIDVPSLSTFLAFIAVSAIVAAFMFVFGAIIMFFMEVITGDNTLNVFKNKVKKSLESPFLFVSMGILFGSLTFIFSKTFPEQVWFLVVVGILEEFIKYLFLRFADEEKIRSISDAISFAILISLGFAFIENIIYLSKFWNTMGQSMSQFTLFFLLRSTLSVIAHLCFSAIMGYFYGIAHFSEKIYQEELKEKQHPALEKLHQILHLKAATLFHEEKLMEGLLLAVLAHTIFNTLLEFGKIAFLLPFLLILFFIVLQLLHLRKSHVNLKNLNQNTF